jgi:tape measure domain-containing protein
MGIVITVKTDLGEAQSSTKAFHKDLQALEKQGDTIGKAIEKGARQGSTAMSAAKQAAKTLRDELERMSNVGRSFQGLSAHFQREADILERMRGPVREATADLNALIRLYDRGKISLSEFAREQERLNAIIARGSGKGDAGLAAKNIGLPGGGKSASGKGGGGGGGITGDIASSIAGYATVGAAIGLGKEVLDLGNDYQQLENRLRSVTSTNSELASSMDKTHALANSTRSDWTSTTEMFVRLTRATQSLGLSQDQVLRLTETLSKTTKISGATTEEAASAMLQLSQAFQSGVLQSDEFRSVNETMPALMDQIAKTMGVTRGELKKMSSDGKITSDILIKSIQDMGTSVDQQFGKMAPTMSEAWTQFKNDATETAGKFLENANVSEILGKALVFLADLFNDIAGVVGPIAHIVGEVAEKFSDFKDKLGVVGTVLDYVMSPLEQLRKAFEWLGDAYDYVAGKSVNWLDQVQQINKASEEHRAQIEATAKAYKDLGLAASGVWDMANGVYDADGLRTGGGFFGMGGDLSGPAFSTFAGNNEAVKLAEKKRKEAARYETQTFGAEGYTRRVTYEDDRRRQNIGIGGPLVDRAYQAELQRAFDNIKQMEHDAAEQSKRDSAEFTRNWDRAIQQYEQKWQDTRDTVASVMDRVGDTLIDSIVEWKNGFKDLTKEIEKAILKLMLMQAIKGFTGGSGSAGEMIAKKIFGFAEGADFTVRGAPGVDNVYMPMMLSAGEHVSITPAGQAQGPGGAARSSGDGGNTIVVADTKAAALAALHSPEGKALIQTVIQNSGGLIRSHITKR